MRGRGVERDEVRSGLTFAHLLAGRQPRQCPFPTCDGRNTRSWSTWKARPQRLDLTSSFTADSPGEKDLL